MTDRSYTIGQVSRMTGVSARRIRFYADKGLLPPYSRTEAGYRVFGDGDVARLQLITALRETEASLATIASVLAKKVTLAEVLTGQLVEVEHRITAQRRIASALRTALRSSEPTVRDLKRVANMIDIAHSERREIAKAFFDRVADGLDLEPNWKPRMIEMGSPELPEAPTNEQVKAFAKEEFFVAMRAIAEDSVQTPHDVLDTYAMGYFDRLKRARFAIERGVSPGDPEAAELAEEQIGALAKMYDVSDDEGFRAKQRIRQQWSTATAPFYKLSNTLRDFTEPAATEQNWLQRAVRERLGT